MKIENDDEYLLALEEYERLKNLELGSPGHEDKMILVEQISKYEEATSSLPDVTEKEFQEIRKEDFES